MRFICRYISGPTRALNPGIIDAAEMTATGWYVRNDADGWTTDAYNSVCKTEGTPAITTAKYAFFNNASTLQYAMNAEIAAGDYYVLEGDTSAITKVEKFNVGDIYYYIFDSGNNVVREGWMSADMSNPGVYGKRRSISFASERDVQNNPYPAGYNHGAQHANEPNGQ